MCIAFSNPFDGQWRVQNSYPLVIGVKSKHTYYCCRVLGYHMKCWLLQSESALYPNTLSKSEGASLDSLQWWLWIGRRQIVSYTGSCSWLSSQWWSKGHMRTWCHWKYPRCTYMFFFSHQWSLRFSLEKMVTTYAILVEITSLVKAESKCYTCITQLTVTFLFCFNWISCSEQDASISRMIQTSSSIHSPDSMTILATTNITLPA